MVGQEGFQSQKNSTNMVTKNVKKSMKEIFEIHMKTLKKHNCKDTDSDSDSKHEYYCMEDVGIDLKDINASKTVALSDLHRPPQKSQNPFATFKDNTTCSLIFLLFVTFSCKLPFGALTAGCITNN